jgi:hypothetical protein
MIGMDKLGFNSRSVSSTICVCTLGGHMYKASISEIKSLKKISGEGFKVCKEVLTECKGNIVLS